jgi:hypothetical protein
MIIDLVFRGRGRCRCRLSAVADIDSKEARERR